MQSQENRPQNGVIVEPKTVAAAELAGESMSEGREALEGIRAEAVASQDLPAASPENEGLKGWYSTIEARGSSMSSPLGSTRIGLIEESPLGRIQFGLSTLSPSDKIPDVVVLASPNADRPLGAGIHSDGAYVAFKNMWDFIPGTGLKLQKTTVVGTAEELDAFKQTMKDEMLNSRAAAFRMGAQTVDELSSYFRFVEFDAQGKAVVDRGGKSVEIYRVENPMDDQPGVGFIVKDQAGEQTVQVSYSKSFEETVELVAGQAAERRAAGKLYSGVVNEPSVQLIGTANLLAPEENSCKVFHDGHGHAVALDFGVSLPRFVEKGGDPDKLTHVLLTHPHADHLIGLPDLLAYREAKLKDGADRLTLIANQHTADTLFRQIGATLGKEKGDAIRRSVDLVVLQPTDDLGYRPIRLDDMRIEAVNVRHSVEDSAGRSATLGFKISTEYVQEGVEKKAVYADSGDTQIGSRYLRHQKAVLSAFADKAAALDGAAPPAGDAFYAEAKVAIDMLKGYAPQAEKGRYEELSRGLPAGLAPAQIAELAERAAVAVGEMNGAILENNRMDMRLFEMMKRESAEVKQVNYVDVGGALGMLPAETLVMGDGTKIEGKAGIVHASSADSAYLYARLSDPGATWIAGHCKADTVAGNYITANPGKGEECEIVDIRRGAVSRFDTSL